MFFVLFYNYGNTFLKTVLYFGSVREQGGSYMLDGSHNITFA